MKPVPTHGEEIRRLRKARGWSQEQLGTACGLPAPATTISHLEADRRTLTLARARTLARHLDVDLAAILRPDEPTTPDGPAGAA